MLCWLLIAEHNFGEVDEVCWTVIEIWIEVIIYICADRIIGVFL